ncbi:uncharacterized protein [Argopecten irradians]|uniref:uncharacterized protein n=1 Tax=Argopecten irradians TaxID=31199 RepID=UPI0037209138
MDGYKFFLFYVFLIGCRAAVIPDPVSSVAIRPSGDANTASNTQIENPEEIKIAAKPDNAAENANTAQSSTSENLSPKSASANAPPSLSGKQTEQSVITADKQVTSVSKVKTASQAAQRKRKTKRILKKLSMQSMDKLRKLVLSKSLKSKSLRRLALMTYVQKANKEGMTSDSIYGKTRLQQFQMDKLMKLSADAVKKLVLNEVKVSDRTRENALKVYLKMNLPSRSEEKVKAITVETPKKKAMNTPPPGVKKGSNVIPWSKANEESKFPVQTHIKPVDISKLMPDSTPPEIIETNLKPEISKPDQGVRTGENVKTVTAQISKEKVAITLPQGVKKGSNVMSWSKENENSEFPVQTHAKALDISKIMPDSTAPESIDTNVKPDISKQDRDVNTGEKVKTVTVQTLMKKVANTPPQGVKKGSNVMQWSKENENSKFPEQTHTKPEDISKLMPDSTPPETIDAKVKPEIRKPGQVVKTGENAKTATAQIPKKVANTIPQGVKKGSNVMQWSKENENSDFPVQTHARQELSELMSDSKPKVVEDIKPEIEKPEAGVKSGDNVPQWSPETENALLQTHARQELNPVPSSEVVKGTNIKPEMSKPDSSVKIADNVPELSPETENSIMQTHARQPSLEELNPVPSSKVVKGTNITPEISKPDSSVKIADNVSELSPETENIIMQTHERQPSLEELNPVPSSEVVKGTNITPEISKPDSSVKIADNVPELSPETENIIMQTHERQPSLEELNPVPSSKVVKGTIIKPEISKPDSSVKIADNVPELSPETENALVQTHTNAEPNIPMMHSETPLSTLTQQIVKEGLRSIREPKTKPPQSDKTMTENNAELSFSSPVGQQQISASDTEAGTTHEKTNPTEMVSSFKKTSQVVSMGKPDPPRTAPEGSILSDKDISALVSSFF